MGLAALIEEVAEAEEAVVQKAVVVAVPTVAPRLLVVRLPTAPVPNLAAEVATIAARPVGQTKAFVHEAGRIPIVHSSGEVSLRIRRRRESPFVAEKAHENPIPSDVYQKREDRFDTHAGFSEIAEAT